MRFVRHFLPLALLLAGTTPAVAHRLIVVAVPDGDRVKVEAYYEDETPARDAKVLVLLGQQTVAEGRTDDKGIWTCPPPAPGTYTVRVQDKGHAGKDTLVIADPNAAPPAVVGPESSDRAEKTRTPWGRILLGLGVIAGLTLFWKFRPRSSPDDPRRRTNIV
jgi:hypothetical protein